MNPGDTCPVILRHYLQANVDASILAPANIVSGPLSNDQQQAGGITIRDAGITRESEVPFVMYRRLQVRALARHFQDVDRIGQHVADLCTDKNRIEVEVPGDPEPARYLVHSLNVVSGPASAYDSPVTEEVYLFVEMCIHKSALVEAGG